MLNIILWLFVDILLRKISPEIEYSVDVRRRAIKYLANLTGANYTEGHNRAQIQRRYSGAV